MPKLGQLVETTKRLVIAFSGGELKIQYRPSAITPRFQKAIAAADGSGDLDALLLQPFCKLVASWDLTDDDGSFIRIEPDAIADLPAEMLRDIMTAIARDVAPDPTRGADSSSISPAMAGSAPSQNGTST